MLHLHPCTEFLNQFLTRRNLKQSTDKPLYTYKTSQTEYERLKTVLKTALPADSTSACFVLFATEWWRRNYSGGHWEWEPILAEIGHPNWLTPARRGATMNNGCRFWQRAIFQHDDGPNSLLGTLFFESGLPLRMLKSDGYISDLLRKAFSFLQTYQTRPEDTVIGIRSLVRESQFPASLNVDAFFALIYDVISTLRDFKTAHQLGSREQPLAYLNQHLPNWREELPLRIDDDPNAGLFLDSLLVDVARMTRQETSKIGLTYSLTQLSDVWTITAMLSIPSGFYKPAHLQLREDIFERLPTKVQLNVISDTKEHEIGFGFKSAGGQLSISGLANRRLPDGIHAERWRLAFAGVQADEQACIDLPFSDGLDPQLPWVFACPEQQPAELAGVGSVRLSANRALVVCPTELLPEGAEGTIQNRGSFSATQTVYEITATCQFQDRIDNQTYRVKLAELSDDPYCIRLYPQSNANYIRFCQQQNAGIFLGFPRLHRLYKQGGHALPVRDRIQYKTQQHTTWHDVTDATQLVGRFKIRSIGPEGEVLFCREITVLPASFGVRFDTTRQRLILDNAGDCTVGVHTDDPAPQLTISREGSTHQIQWHTGNQGDQVRLRLVAPGTKSISLHVPYPSSEGYFTDATGQVLANNHKMALTQLYGAQLVLNNVSATPQTTRLTLTLNDRHDNAAGQHQAIKMVKVAPFSGLALSLAKYKGEIEQLLSHSGTIDAVVRLQHNNGMCICVTHYTAQTQYNHETGFINLTGPAPADGPVRISAFPLSERFTPESLVELERHDEGWAFPANAPAGGKWFYCSTPDSVVSIRPAVATRQDGLAIDTNETIDELHDASNHSYSDRQTVLIDLFDRMADNFDNVNWTTLQQLHQCTGHLPLNALDVWKALVCSKKGLVAFFLRFDSATINRLTRQFAVNWHGIAVDTWLAEFRAYQAYLPATVADMIIAHKVQELEADFDMSSLAQIVRVTLLDEAASPDFQMCQHAVCIQPILNDEVMGRHNLPGLMQRHHGHQFPACLREEIAQCYAELPAVVRQLLPTIPGNFGYVRQVAHLPVLMAYQTVCPNVIPDVAAFNRQYVSQLIDFDPEYFNLVYNIIQAFCWFNFPNQ
ncbi:hypothetical protein CLV58_1468 [Spirosoma oryzae]|uniref:Uncharacterized protein n=1 Tax=Spirosoma oryzae TaxID=1469603 RepID=A0A2T0RM80_9BACT|nr:STY4851/ECs_5259 family protein [Spirosoma oryzae]PRY22295.1 hypothetical protein CLV58_1468 [Spirosoma oryzae]